MEMSLYERVDSYIQLSDYQLLKKLPVVIMLNGRAFSKATSLLEKPYDEKFMELMIAVMVKLIGDIEGVVFSYTYNDNIVVAIKNDQTIHTEAWYNNKLQAIVSASASIASVEFNRIINVQSIKILGDPVFTAKAFVVPSLVELSNTIIHMQQNCFHTSLSHGVFYELWKLYGADKAMDLLDGKNSKEKSRILSDRCKIEFNDYPLPFKRGVAVYRAPRFNPKTGDIKNKLTINEELPLFSQEKEWLLSLLTAGTDTISLGNS